MPSHTQNTAKTAPASSATLNPAAHLVLPITTTNTDMMTQKLSKRAILAKKLKSIALSINQRLTSKTLLAVVDVGLTLYGFAASAIMFQGTVYAITSLSVKFLDMAINHSESINNVKDAASSKFNMMAGPSEKVAQKAEHIAKKVPSILRKSISTINNILYTLEGYNPSSIMNLARGSISAFDVTKCGLTMLGINTLKNDIIDMKKEIAGVKKECLSQAQKIS